VNEFVTSASVAGPRDGVLRDDIPQFAFAGRSNVGKSSLLNALMRQKLARTSAAAGKTRQANVFKMTFKSHGGAAEWSIYLVDLPGYGYARGGAESIIDMKAVVEAYFSAARRPTIFLLVDSRHPGLASDIEAYKWIVTNAAMPHVIATKVDKLSRTERTKNFRAIADVFGQKPLAVSADSGEGLDDLRRLMISLAQSGEQP
jgi:GTP-binding protein